MIRIGLLFERIYKSPKDLVCSLHRLRTSAIVVLSVFVYKVTCGNCRAHSVLHRSAVRMQCYTELPCACNATQNCRSHAVLHRTAVRMQSYTELIPSCVSHTYVDFFWH